MKKEQKFPPGWDDKRVQKVIMHYETQTEDESVIEDEITFKDEKKTIMEIPYGVNTDGT